MHCILDARLVEFVVDKQSIVDTPSDVAAEVGSQIRLLQSDPIVYDRKRFANKHSF